MQRTNQLFKLASKFANKYAGIDAANIKDDVQNSIQTAVANASSVKASGIMPFLNMLDQDQTNLAINVTRHGNTVTVSTPSIDSMEAAPKYVSLPGQIKNYLEQHLEVFPTHRNGEPIDYNNLTVTLDYPSASQQGIAQR